MPEGSESGLEGLKALLDKMAQEIKQELKQEIGAVAAGMDLMREELVAVRRRCEGSTEVVQSGVEEVVAAQSPVSDQQLCGMTGHCDLRVSVADMKKPCLLGLDSLFGNAACDLGRMQRKVRGEVVPMVLEDAVKQVENPVTSLDVEERLELNCGVVREREAPDATEEACGSQAEGSSCGVEVNGGTRKVGPGGSGSGQSEAGQQRAGV